MQFGNKRVQYSELQRQFRDEHICSASEDLNLNPRTHVESIERLHMFIALTLEDRDRFQEPATPPRQNELLVQWENISKVSKAECNRGWHTVSFSGPTYVHVGMSILTLECMHASPQRKIQFMSKHKWSWKTCQMKEARCQRQCEWVPFIWNSQNNQNHRKWTTK